MTNIQVEDVSDVKKRLTFEVPQEKVASLLDTQYKDLRKNVQIRGFRKGKVPMSVLKGYFQKQVHEDIKRTLIEETFQPGLDEKRLTMVSLINIDSGEVNGEDPFTYTAEIEVPPPVELKQYKGLKLTKYFKPVTDEEVAERLEALREQQAKLVPLDDARPLQKDDHASLDIKASVDGQESPALSVTDYMMELGRDFYLPGFDEKIQGMKVEESKKIAMDLPDDFYNKELAGKSVELDVTVNEAKVRSLPELDDEFAADLGDYASLNDLKAEIHEDLEKLYEQKYKKELEKQVIDALIENHDVEVPDAMVESQTDVIIQETIRGMARYGIDPNRLPPPTDEQRQQVRPDAERTVKAGLILKAVSEAEELEVTDDDLEEAVKTRSEHLGESVDYFKKLLEDQGMLNDFRAGLLQDKVMDFLTENAEITEKEAPPEETEDDDTEKE